MLKLAPYFAGGCVALLLMNAAPIAGHVLDGLVSVSSAAPVAGTPGAVDRSHKGDRLVTTARSTRDVPALNASFITKGSMLPGATSERAAVKPVPVETAKPATKPHVPVGCDPAFSPLANGASANFASRCLS